MNYWTLLPDEIHKEIFYELDDQEIFVFQFVCKKWYTILKNINSDNSEWIIRYCLWDGDDHLLQWLVINKGFKMIDDAYKYAIFRWNLKSLQWLKKINYKWNWKIWREVLENCRCEGCYYPLKSECIFNKDIISILDWLLKEKCPWNSKILEHTIATFQDKYCLQVCKWLVRNGCPVSYNTFNSKRLNKNNIQVSDFRMWMKTVYYKL